MPLMIKARHLAGCQSGLDERFAEELLAQLRTEYAGRRDVLERATVRHELLVQIRKARLYRLTSDRDLRAFACLTLFVADRWDEYPVCKRLLQDETLEAGEGLRHMLFTWGPAEWEMIKAWSIAQAAK